MDFDQEGEGGVEYWECVALGVGVAPERKGGRDRALRDRAWNDHMTWEGYSVLLFCFCIFLEGGNDILLALLHWEFINNTLFYSVTLYNKIPLVNIS